MGITFRRGRGVSTMFSNCRVAKPATSKAAAMKKCWTDRFCVTVAFWLADGVEINADSAFFYVFRGCVQGPTIRGSANHWRKNEVRTAETASAEEAPISPVNIVEPPESSRMLGAKEIFIIFYRFYAAPWRGKTKQLLIAHY